MVIELPYPPSANRYWRMAKGHMIVSDEAKGYKQAIGLICNVAALEPVDGAVSVSIEIRRPAKRRDLDNHAKVLLDSLEGHAYRNDGQIVELYMRMTDNPESPGATVTVTKL